MASRMSTGGVVGWLVGLWFGFHLDLGFETCFSCLEEWNITIIAGVNADMLTAGKRKNKRAAETGQKALTHNGACPEDVPLVAMGQQQVLEPPAGEKKCIENALEEGEKRKMPIVLENPSPTKKSKGGDKGKEVGAAEEREHPNFGCFWGVHNKNDKPTWLNKGFKMPEDVKHLMELADELVDVPPLNNILAADLSPQARELVGQGLLKRVTLSDGYHISETFPSALAGRLGDDLAEIATCGHLLFDQARHVAEADVKVESLTKINKYLDDQRKKLDADLTIKVGECSNLELEVKKWKLYYHNASQEALQTAAKVKDLGLQLKATKTGISHLTKEQKVEICLEFQQSKEYKEALTYEAMTLYQQGQQHVFRMMAAAGIHVDIEERVRWAKTKHYDEEARKGAGIVPYATEEYLHLKGWVPPPAVPNNIMDRVYWVEEEEDDGCTQVEGEATQADANAAAVGGADANAAVLEALIAMIPLGNHSSVAAYELPPKQNA